MKKALKIAGKISLGLLAALLVVLAIVFVYNKIMLKKEAHLFEQPLGKMIEVDGHNMCVYTEGDGEHTIVFLSGSGTASPILDFRSLYKLLSNDFKIVVIEKFGYGFSDIVDSDRAFDTMLRQNREALSKLGINAPFILCPHSMSGLEAILWELEYPDEVEAVIGLDMALPKSYDKFNFKRVLSFEKFAAQARKMGLIRFFYNDSFLPAELSETEKKLYRAIACKIAVNKVIMNEGLAIPRACKKINDRPMPNISTLLFVSNGKDVCIKNWIEIQKEYAEKLPDASIIELNCGHYVHNFEQKRIAAEMRKFIKEL